MINSHSQYPNEERVETILQDASIKLCEGQLARNLREQVVDKKWNDWLPLEMILDSRTREPVAVKVEIKRYGE